MKLNLHRPQALCLIYFLLHVLAHLSANWFEVRTDTAASIWYAPSGLALALLVLLGPRYAPVVFAANFTTAWLTEAPRVVWTSLFFPALITASYGTVAWLVRRHFGPRLLPGTQRETLAFSLAVLGAPLIPALIGVTVIKVTFQAEIPWALDTFIQSVTNWWIGDASGILTVVPAAMVFAGPWLLGQPSGIDWSPSALLAGSLRGAVLLSTVILVLAVPDLRQNYAFYLCFLPLVWIAVRHGLPGATLAALLVTMVGLVSMRFSSGSAEFAHVFLLFVVAVVGVSLGLGTVVTSRNETQTSLAASQARLDRAISGAQLGLWDWDISARRFDSNHHLASMLGYPPEELQGISEASNRLIHPSDQPAVRQAVNDHLEGRTPIYEAEYRLRAKDGTWHWIHSRGSIVRRDDENRPLQVSGTHLDITARKSAEDEVNRLLEILEATPDFILTTDSRGGVLYANNALLSFLGPVATASPWRGRAIHDLIPGESGRRLREEIIPSALAAGSWHGEFTLTHPSGREIPTSQIVLSHRDKESVSFTLSFILHDISAQKQAASDRLLHERQLLQLQKSESLGILAGGIAHDFNNLLTAILGNTNLVRLSLPLDAPSLPLLSNVETAATNAAALCQQMLAYSGQATVAFSEVDLNQLIEETLRFLESSISRKIMIRHEAERPLAHMLAAPAQMQQLVMNLALNAADAIGDREGLLTLRTRSRHFDAAELRELFPSPPFLATGTHVILEVEDTGCGMSAEVQSRIFEPFFTTKFIGKGLGLAAVGGIVKSHRGAVFVRSSPGRGAMFRIAFPAIMRALPDPDQPPPPFLEIPEPEPPPVEPSSWTSSGVILVVDDDPMIRTVTTRLLAKLGFSPVLASDGLEGVTAFREHASRLRCVMLDLTMPRMDGFEAHAEMHRIDPSVPVILMSGFSQKLAHLPPSAIHPAGILAKPFGIDQLVERLKQVLANRPAPPAGSH